LPSLKADVIKIDIDGSEPLIMDSLCEVIDHNGPMVIFLEYLPGSWKGYEPLPILQRFAERGFHFHILQNGGPMIPTRAEDLAVISSATYLDLLLTRS
jgi:hypothetical protein